jgi:hypothetical protein
MVLWLLRNRSEKIKTMALTGMLLADKLYTHGDASSNNAISMMAAPYCNNVCLVEPHGAFGSRIGVSEFGAARYTSVSRSKAAQAFLYNDIALCPLEDNYDGSNQQPKHFLPLIPTVLLNGVSGIAVGWSTNILPHALRDLIDATKQALRGQKIAPLIPSYDKYDISIESVGANQWQLSGKVSVVDTSTVRITELPPGLSIEAFRKRLIAMEDADQINGYTDRSTDAIDITVKFKRGTIAGWSEQAAIDFFKLRERVTERIVVLGWDGASIQTYDCPEALVRDFAAWRLGWYTTRFEKLLADGNYELTYWLALAALFEAKFPKRLGTFVDRAALQLDVTKTLEPRKIVVDAAQLERIVSLPTYRWTQEFAAEVAERIRALRVATEEYRVTLASPDRLKLVYLNELDQLRGLKL